MTENASISFDSEREFLAHAHALEQELAQHYEVMANCMEVHNNAAVSSLFLQLSRYGETLAGKLILNANVSEMPKVPPWKYQWLDIVGTEDCMDAASYLMTTYQALGLALRMEQGSSRFYELTILGSPTKSVKELAVKMLDVKQEHLALLHDWLSRVTEEHDLPPVDLDPPNMPE